VPAVGQRAGSAGSDRNWRRCVGLVGGLEQFDDVAGGVSEQDLAPAGAGDRVAAKGHASAGEPGDLGIQVVDDEVDAVAASGGGVVGGGAGAGTGGSGQQEAKRAAYHVGECGCGAGSSKPRWAV
jgi:hypothetical protein